ncbi:MAG: tyrosine-type recombinase/integrase [Clostridia bacterium]|nr:tyrosine-type recombinase/integrase [Clostridia bacterium]
MATICNIKNVTFHMMRRTFASECIEAGVDVKSLSEILGHSIVNITLNRYVHSSMQIKKMNMKKLYSL